MDIKTLAAARKYVDDTANALGAVKGSPCTITSITEADDGIHIIFSWAGTDGTVATQTAIMPYVAVDKVARESIETLREDMGEAIDTTVRSINGRKPDSKGNVALPLSVTGVPNTGSPNQTFVTDSSGNPVWEDRTHYADKTWDEAIHEIELHAYDDASAPAGVTTHRGTATIAQMPVAGDVCKVTINDVEFVAIAEVSNSVVVIGNKGIIGVGEDTGETCCCIVFTDGTVLVGSRESVQSVTVRVEVEKETIHPLDPKYLPADITIPSGGSLTLAAGATVNDEAGVLGGSGGAAIGIVSRTDYNNRFITGGADGEKIREAISNGELTALVIDFANQIGTLWYSGVTNIGGIDAYVFTGLVMNPTKITFDDDIKHQFVTLVMPIQWRDSVGDPNMLTQVDVVGDEIAKTLSDTTISGTYTFGRNGIVLSDSNNGKWNLVVGTDGTLSTEAVTE